MFSGERAFRFRHILIRDAAYESIPKQERATLHERHAVWLEASVGHRALDLEEIVGYHFEQAFVNRSELGPIDDATRALGKAAAAARRRWTTRARSQRRTGRRQPHLSQCRVALARRSSSRRARTQHPCHPGTDRPELGGPSLTEAVEAAATTGDRRLAAHALVQRGFLRLFTTKRSLLGRSSTLRIERSPSSRDLTTSSGWRGRGALLDRLTTWIGGRACAGKRPSMPLNTRAEHPTVSRSERSSNGL